jgi:FkbM family methyltransferase
MGILSFIRHKKKQKEMEHFYANFISKGDLCFDVGANIGERAEIFLKLGAKVVCIEPQTKCVDVLKKKFDNENVTILPYAIGSQTGETELMLCDETDECSTLSKEFVSTYAGVSNFHWTKKQKVKVETLENICEKYGLPKLCKIDVEGYESEVFKGLRTPIDIICFEFNRPLLNDTKRSLESLAALSNYECNYIVYERMNLVMPAWIPIKEFTGKVFHTIKEDVLTGEIVVRKVK